MEAIKVLVERSQAGDLNAYGELVGRFQDMAYGYAYSLLGDFHLAEDAAQEAFIEAFRKLSQVRKPEAFPGWFRKVVWTQCQRILRRKELPVQHLEGDLASQKGDPSEGLAKAEMKDSVLSAIQALPEHERTATTLFYINGYSQEEIAGFLAVPVTTVKNRLHTSRKRLKERMLNMAKKNLRAHAPNRKFADRIIEKMRPVAGQWQVREQLLEGSWRGGAPLLTPWDGYTASPESCSGEHVVAEFEGMTLYGMVGTGVIQCVFSPSETPPAMAEGPWRVEEFGVRSGGGGQYYWSGLRHLQYRGRFSRERGPYNALGEHHGRMGIWYRIRAERLGQWLRLWVDDVPVYEEQVGDPAPEKVWVMLGATVTHNLFRNFVVREPDQRYVRQYSQPQKLFAPAHQKRAILAKYPPQVVREATVTLGRRVSSKGLLLIDAVRGDAPIPTAVRVAGHDCREVLDVKHGAFMEFAVAEPEKWSRHNEIDLEFEYLDKGCGSIVGFYNTWYHPRAFTEDLLLQDSGKWKRHTFRLREVAFRSLPATEGNLSLSLLGDEGGKLRLRSVRLTETARPQGAYEEVAAAYEHEIHAGKGLWTVPHYMMHLAALLQGNLQRWVDGERLLADVFRAYPDSDCAEAYQVARAHW